MTPEHVQDLVDDYLHDNLEPHDAARVEAHCGACPGCKAALDAARRRLAALRALPVHEASEEMIERTTDRVEEYGARRRTLIRRLGVGVLGALAASAALIVAMQTYYSHLITSPWDLKVLGQSELLAGSSAAVRVCLLDRVRNRPVSGVPVIVTLRNKASGNTAEVVRFTTDAAGTGATRFVVPEWPDGDCELLVQAYAEGPDPEAVARPVRVRRSWKLMLSSDKPVYRPGQTIHLRSLALRRPDLKPVAAEPVAFTVTDPKGNVIFKHEGRNSAFGITAADCELANEILEGAYTVACKVGDTESRLAVDVHTYVLPKFQVGVVLDKPYYAPGDTVTATVSSDYFFGQPVAGGEARLEVQAPEVGRPLLHKAAGKTDAAGRTVFTFALPKELTGLPQDSGDARLSVQVQVADAAGQRQGRAASLVVTNRPLRLEIIPEGGTLFENFANTVYLFASYADGRPAKVRVEGPNEIKFVTNELGAGSFEVTPFDAAGLEGVFRARDDKGVFAEKEVHLACGQDGRDFHVRADKAVYDGGDTMKLTMIGGISVEPIFVDLIKDGQTMLTRVLDVQHGSGREDIDLPPDLSGTLQLCAYRIDGNGVPVRKTRTLYVRPASGLNVKATLDREEYRPGGKAKLTLELRGKDGRPAPGALSLAAVDEAVFSVLKQRPGTEGAFFALEEELLRPVTTLYPWAPDLATGVAPEERNRLEQTLFARTTQTTSSKESATSAPHTLAGSSYPAKVAQLERDREAGRRRVTMAWVVLVVGALILGDLCLWAFLRPLWVVGLGHLIGLVLVCGTLGMMAVVEEKFAATAMGMAGEKMSPTSAAGDRPPPGAAGGDQPTLRVRQEFPETLLWRPEVITDDAGQAALDIDLADSITTWRLSASAVTADGRLGATQAGIKVFQPFFVDLNLPASLTRGDEAAVPVVVYNYLDKPQTVELTLADADGFERLEEPGKRLALAAREVRSTSYRLRARKVGRHQLEVAAKGAGVADAVRRPVEVVPDGRRVEQVTNGALSRPAEMTLTVPENAVEGSGKLLVKIYPSSFSQLVEGLDGIFQVPHGCFEQTSSTTYPNVLALDYLKRTGKAAPEVEAKARQYIHLGYQRLLSFEVSGGGFDWYGRPPANVSLTAYGLMEFRDMVRVHDVDPALIARTRRWLLSRRAADGSWTFNGRGVPSDWLGLTAYVAWAVFGGEPAADDGVPTRDYLLRHSPETIDDPYVLALVCNALDALDLEGESVKPYLDRLARLKKTTEDGKVVFWEQAPGRRTTFYGAGRSASVETTALAVLALLPHNHDPAAVRGGLAWLAKQKDAQGTWPSTQATVLALKALLAGSTKVAGGDGERRIEIVLDGKARAVVVPADQAEVMRQLDLSEGLTPGNHSLALRETSGTGAGYQVVFRHYVPGAEVPAKPESLTIQVAYDRAELTVDDTLTATATVSNRMKEEAPMVMLDLPVPPGFVLAGDDLAKAAEAGTIGKVQVPPRGIVIYLRGLAAGQSLTLTYRLRATMPVKVGVSPARVYEYYDVDKEGKSAPVRLTVKPR